MKNILEFKTLTEFTDYFCDEETCVKHFAAIRFANGEYCPHCNHNEIYTFKDGKRYRCAKCKQDFTIKTGTVFGESKLPIRKWFMAIYLLLTCKKGIIEHGQPAPFSGQEDFLGTRFNFSSIIQAG
jgi:transposase-like protein